MIQEEKSEQVAHLLNEHNKQEYPPMHTCDFDTLLI